MPIFLLCIKAELENVGSLRLKEGASFCFDVQEGGGSEVRKNIHVSPLEEHELSGSKGSAHYVMKFDKGSRREATISVIDVKGVAPGALTAEDAEKRKFAPIAAFECRGLELIGYRPEGDWIVQAANSKTKWEDVDLSEGEWTEYDEKAPGGGESVGIFNISHEFRLTKV
mmetsp:Transcript_16612/g.28513  ORF Transcript_16612/g.28513 Transcript_16612/m.28513 type:complete len:170 (+) Transcript_16612:84-593(+)|eukprot:CAMPEP_0119109058 /NCGR_PEP_ID=MMETSP1180-20130426/17041_1 /TAXON_ID=3052 ORGANISM="Chlamydomonas cf sp, Strain CCMP681" /NCGR_SAMPLE_ID=MMETSP1180 /ASSEMBLY_ACC=CAM_ASM_000741 /LENGTH=169 /DNA_ID=CAMNT_0007094763 /DNA_START=84 /DNA_END=593 /DNA_ORIENTATION=+